MANQFGVELGIEAITPRLRGEQGADRGFIAGRSGSGKTFLATSLLANYTPNSPSPYRGYLCIIDPNGNFEFPASAIAETPEEAIPSKRNPVIIYRPNSAHDNPEGYNDLYRGLFQSKDRIMTYCDEIFAMEGLFQVKSPNWLRMYLTRGRALGKGALNAAQRPVTIPRNLLAQANYFYMFDLPLEEDRIYMAGILGRLDNRGRDIRARNSLGKFEFFFLGPDDSLHGSERRPVRMKING